MTLASAHPRIPVLTYHGQRILTNDYGENDHIALREDLRALTDAGWRVVPASRVVAWHAGRLSDADVERAVAITFDDGTWFDYHDLDHPTCGPQRSLFNILVDHARESGAEVSAAAFVIASPVARDLLDERALVGGGWWGEDWWRPAQQSGTMTIECHSWDHVHPLLDEVAHASNRKGDFAAVDQPADCDTQVTRAGEYIRKRAGPRSARLFAYPFGEYSDYLANRWFPTRTGRHRFAAAFTTEAKPVERSDNAWTLPRFVFGRDWKTPEAFARLLGDCS
jgi:peptidoglycan/xylan/chitin deacetylase (PgdA/CDA1 family)